MSKAKKLQQKVGYGNGLTVGFTMDGSVFIASDSKDPEGRPIQFFIELTPQKAEGLAKSLIDASVQAGKSKKVA